MFFDVFSPAVDGAIILNTNAAPVTKPDYNSTTTDYSVFAAKGHGGFHGAYSDFFTFDPSQNIDSFSLAGFDNHASLQTSNAGVVSYKDIGPVVTFTANYDDGSSGFPFGGLVIGANSDGFLVEQISGFFATGGTDPSTGGNVFVGTLSPNYQIFMNTTNLSLTSGTPPTLPLVFEAVPEPSSVLMFAVAAVAIVAARRLRSAVRAV